MAPFRLGGTVGGADTAPFWPGRLLGAPGAAPFWPGGAGAAAPFCLGAALLRGLGAKRPRCLAWPPRSFAGEDTIRLPVTFAV